MSDSERRKHDEIFFKEAISLTTQTLFQVFFLILQPSNEPFLKKLKKRPSNYLKFKGGGAGVIEFL